MVDIQKKKVEKKGINYIYVLCLLALVLFVIVGVHFLRESRVGVFLIGDDSYSQLKIAKDIMPCFESDDENLECNFLSRLFFNFQNNKSNLNLFNLLLSLLALKLPIYTAYKFIGVLVALLSVFLAYLLLIRFNFSQISSVIILSILIISPFFIYSFAILPYHSLIIFLFLLVFYLLTSKNIILEYLSIVLVLVLFSFGPLVIFILILFLLMFFYYRTKRRIFLFILFLIALLSLYYIISFLGHSFLLEISGADITVHTYLQNLISDFGSIYGFGVFHVILLLFGFVVSWKSKEKYYPLYLILLVLLILVTRPFNELVIYVFILSSLFMGIGLLAIIKRDWSIPLMGELTIILLICGLLFSFVAYVDRSVEAEPTKELIEALGFLSRQPDGMVFSHYSRGHLIEAIAEKPALTNSNFEGSLLDYKLINDSNVVFNSRDLFEVMDILGSYNVKYIWVDDSLKNGLVWENEGEGMLFLFRNKDVFELLYKNEKVQIYEINYSVNLS